MSSSVNYCIMKRQEALKIFSENLRAERARKNYSQEFLAEKAQVTQKTIYEIENQKRNPTILVVANLALALEITIDKLMPLD